MQLGLNLALAALLLGSCGGYYLLDHQDELAKSFLFLFTLQFAIFGALFLPPLRRRLARLPFWIGVGIAARVVLWFSEPVLEADYFRYLWDGHVYAQGINPYLYPPEHPALDEVETNYRFLINWSQYPTIYPPLAQYAFRLVHAVAPDSLLALKVFFTLLDLGTGFLLVRFLRERGVEPIWSLLYFLNPLVLKEVANSAHLEPLPVLLSFAAVYLMATSRRRRPAVAWLLLTLAVAAKLYPLVLVPLFLRVDPGWKRHGAMAFALLALLYLPFLGAGPAVFSGTGTYAAYWLFNASLFQLVSGSLQGALRLVFGDPPSSTVIAQMLSTRLLAKLVIAGLFTSGLVWRTSRLKNGDELPRAACWILGLLLILSPVVDAWYVLWILPFACLLLEPPWIAFSYLVAAGYFWFWSPELAPAVRLVEYGLFFGLLLYWHRRHARIDTSTSIPAPATKG